ncbi:18495_t:CDS:2, partial [Gigaspora rosea]
MESQFEELKRMLQLLINKLNMNEKLEIKGRQIYENMALYLQDLNQNTEIEPIISIETASSKWKKKLNNNKEVLKELYQWLTDSKEGL